MKDREEFYNGEIVCTTPVCKESGTMYVSFDVGLCHDHTITIEIKGMDFLEWFDSKKIAEIREGVKDYVDSK